ncbi:hypothetical protein CC86DRAFT_410712 [Ophiobolus disseminans]|uniref:Protein kinase domain-containing protein n=1 Tax=Ophiobolus disseminans TaxID=1469910 RepID=A0A6A6ZKJ8_9PLEO|nr:hypothetical protein CC86DRAFT_410712 [Ophiobolus disseminans]
MDQVDASLEIINLICTTLLFIHNVTNDSLQSASTPATLIEHHTFLDGFADLCFGDVTGILRDARVSKTLVLDVQRSLHSLNKVLAAHREAWRYMSVTSEIKKQQTIRRGTISFDADDEKKKWRDEMKQRSQIWKERAGPAAHSTLFDEEEMNSLVLSCSMWIDRLRHSLSIVLLMNGEPSPHFPTIEQATHLGITRMLERQRRIGLRPSGNYIPLTGRLRRSVGIAQLPTSLMKTIYNDGSEEIDVMVEVRPYNETPAGAVRQLTWYLSASHHQETTFKQVMTQDQYGMLSLRCLGYIDDAGNARSLILYRSPQSHPWASSPPSLHDIIMKGWVGKLGLSQRFRVARTLAASILDIHTSGSRHSNINSRNIAMMPRQLNDPEPLPYLLGWGAEPLPTDELMALEQNLYRHQTQFGRCSSPSTTEQDVYSLGVVLLEIGLWTTMPTVFAKLLETSPRFSAREENAVFKKVSRVVLDLAYGPDVRREMGERYARVVQNCLKWNRRDASESLLEFRKEVVDVLNAGCVL